MNQLSRSGWLALKASKGGRKCYPLTATCSNGCRLVRCKDPAQCWHMVGAQQMWLPLFLLSPSSHPRWHCKEMALNTQSQCISAVQCSLHKHLPLLMETPGAFPLSILSSTCSWGRVSAIMKKSTDFNHTGLKGSGRSGLGLRVKNNICTLLQLPQRCNPIEEAHESLTNLQWALCSCLLRCFHHFYLCQPDIQEPTTASLLEFALSLLEPPLSLCTVGCKCL